MTPLFLTAMADAGLGQKQDPGTLQVSHVGAGLMPYSVAFPDMLAALQAKHPGLKPVPMWNASIPGSGLTHFVTVPAYSAKMN